MLIHPWDAALDRRVLGVAGLHRPVRDPRGQQPRPDPGPDHAAHPLHRRRGRAAPSPGPAEPCLAIPGSGRPGTADRDRRLRLHPLTYWRAKAGGPDEDGLPTSDYTTVQFLCQPTVVDDPQGKAQILTTQLAQAHRDRK